MIHDQHDCVRSAVGLLTEVSEALSGEANTVLREKIDGVILQLSMAQEIEHFDARRISEILGILGDGLALIPSIVELILKLNH